MATPQIGFDVNSARQSGYSDDEILQHLAQTRKFDVQGALSAGYSKPEVIDHMAQMSLAPNPDTNPVAVSHTPNVPGMQPVASHTPALKQPKLAQPGPIARTVASLNQQAETTPDMPLTRRIGGAVTRGVVNMAGFVPQTIEGAITPPTTYEEAVAQQKLGGPENLGGLSLASHRLLTGPMQAEAEKARQEFAQGKNLDATVHAAASGVPVVGPIAASLYDRARSGDVAGALTEGAIYAGAPAALEAVKGAPFETPNPAEAKALAQSGVNAIAESKPVQAAGKVLNPSKMDAVPSFLKATKPRNTVRDIVGSAERGLPLARRAADSLGIDVNDENFGHAEALQSIVKAKQDVWNQLEQNHLMPAANAVRDVNGVGEKIASVANGMSAIEQRRNPNLVQAINDSATDYLGKQMSVQDIEQRIQELNNQLASEQGKLKVEQNVLRKDPAYAYQFAELESLRGVLNNALDELTGTGAAQLKKSYGDLTKLQDVTERSRNVADRQSPAGIFRSNWRIAGVGDIGGGLWQTVTGHPEQGVPSMVKGYTKVKMGENAQLANDRNYMIRQAFQKTNPAQTILGNPQLPETTAPVAPEPQDLGTLPIPEPSRQAPTSPAVESALPFLRKQQPMENLATAERVQNQPASVSPTVEKNLPFLRKVAHPDVPNGEVVGIDAESHLPIVKRSALDAITGAKNRAVPQRLEVQGGPEAQTYEQKLAANAEARKALGIPEPNANEAAYHATNPEDVESVLRDGYKTGSRLGFNQNEIQGLMTGPRGMVVPRYGEAALRVEPKEGARILKGEQLHKWYQEFGDLAGRGQEATEALRKAGWDAIETAPGKQVWINPEKATLTPAESALQSTPVKPVEQGAGDKSTQPKQEAPAQSDTTLPPSAAGKSLGLNSKASGSDTTGPYPRAAQESKATGKPKRWIDNIISTPEDAKSPDGMSDTEIRQFDSAHRKMEETSNLEMPVNPDKHRGFGRELLGQRVDGVFRVNGAALDRMTPSERAKAERWIAGTNLPTELWAGGRNVGEFSSTKQEPSRVGTRGEASTGGAIQTKSGDVAASSSEPVQPSTASQVEPPSASQESVAPKQSDVDVFKAGADAESKRSPEANNLGKVLNGVAQVLETKDIAKPTDKNYLKSAKEWGVSPFYHELHNLFSNVFHNYDPRTATPEQIGKDLGEHYLPTKPEKVDENGWTFRYRFDEKNSAESMKKSLKSGEFPQQLEKAQRAADRMRRQADIIEALSGRSEKTEAARRAADETEKGVNDARSRAESAIKDAEQRESDKKAAEERMPVTLAEKVRPLSELRTTYKKGWNGSGLKPNQNTSWIADEHMMIDSSAANGKAGEKTIAQMRIPNELLESMRTKDGKDVGVTASAIDSVLSSATKEAKNKLEFLGMLPKESHEALAREKNDIAYFSTPKGELIAVNPHKLALLNKAVDYDTVMGAKDKALVFSKNGKTVAVLMPMRDPVKIDIETARKTLSGNKLSSVPPFLKRK